MKEIEKKNKEISLKRKEYEIKKNRIMINFINIESLFKRKIISELNPCKLLRSDFENEILEDRTVLEYDIKDHSFL